MTARRSVVIHADDLGMSHGANLAFRDLAALGTVTCGSVMVPCPWFAELAAMARSDPALDIGVHLTLTSEMPGYRWRPLTRPSRAAGLTDDDGFLHRNVPTLRARADPAAVEAELAAQVETALGAGIDVTHLDDHMGAVLAPEFVAAYVRVAQAFRLPPVICPTLSTYGGPHNMTGIDEAAFAAGPALARAAGFALVDRIVETDWQAPAVTRAGTRARFAALPSGLSFLALHPAAPGDIAAIDPGSHHLRSGEYRALSAPGLRLWLEAQDMDLSGMRPFRDAFRASHSGELRA